MTPDPRIVTAVRAAQIGLSTFPYDPDGRYTGRPKKPLVKWTQFRTRPAPESEWLAWVRRWPECNIGLITGVARNRFVLDFDTVTDYAVWVSEIGEWFIQNTLVIATGRGYHVHFDCDTPTGNGFTASHPNGARVEIKGGGNFVAIPPSVHHSGRRYRVVNKMPALTVASIEGVLGGFAHLRPQIPLLLPKSPTEAINGPVEKIKARVKIEHLCQVVSKPDSQGRVSALCPLPKHGGDDHHSFWINLNEQVCGCRKCTPFGTWDVINLYAAIHDLDNAAAIAQLLRMVG